ncbi:MAG: hypothetical protein ACYC5X_16400, partial [Syntrophales bacterium]
EHPQTAGGHARLLRQLARCLTQQADHPSLRTISPETRMMGKDRFQNLIAHGPLFIPRWGSYLCRLEQRPARDIFDNPVRLCMALRRTQQLFALNAICMDLPIERIICADPLNMTELLDNFEVMLEAYRGLSRIIEPEIGLFPYIPGPGNVSRAIDLPASLTETAWFERCRDTVLSLIRHLGEANIFTAVFIDESMINPMEFSAAYCQALRAIFNLLAFYELAVLLIRQAPPDKKAAPSGIEELSPTAIVFPSDRATLPKKPAFTGFTGRAISPELFASGNDVILRIISDMLEHRVTIITTAGEVPPNVEPRTIHALSHCICDHT